MSIKHQIFCGDSNKLTPKLKNDSVDLVLTDPPYKNYLSQRTKDKQKKIKKGTFSFVTLVEDIERILKPNRHFYIWCDALTYSDAFNAIQNSKLLRFKNLIVWPKQNHGSGDLKAGYAPQHELCIFGHKLRGRPFFTKRAPDVLFKKIQGCMEFYKKVPPKVGGHPTIKPVDILSDFISRSSKPNEVVWDPYAGSFSTGEAAKKLGRRSISFELEPKYCAMGRKKLN